jgi:RNA polymerase sigma-70 factor (ECF subfamily)
MIPLSEQDPRLWRRDVIDEADALLIAAEKLDSVSPRFFQALLQRIWCNRQSLDNPAPWLDILRLYDRLLKIRDDAIVRVNRVVALAEVESLDAALNELLQLENSSLTGFLSFHAVHADLLCRLGRIEEATIAYRKVLALDPSPSERVWIQRKLTRLADK